VSALETRPTANADRAEVAAPFERADVVPDSTAWELERRTSLGASEVPAVLGLSPYATPLDVYRAKYGGGRAIDEELAFIGHAEEVVIGRWLQKFRRELGVIRRGFMARSLEAPWLSCTFDRFVVKRRVWTPVQMKTAHQYAGDEWEEGVPLAVQAQIQTELFVGGFELGYAVAFVGGRRFHLHPVARDEEWIREILIPQTRAFWHEHVLAGVPPEPSSPAEAVSLWPGGEGEVDADEETVEAWSELLEARRQAAELEKHVDELKLRLQIQMRDATKLIGPGGDVLATWNPKRGAAKFDLARFAADHPELAPQYLEPGRPTRQFLPKTIKEKTR
jgi:putative phage-type endonuclease